MIVGLTGPICSGKKTLAKYLADRYNFEIIDILELFREQIKEIKTRGITIDEYEQE